MKGQMVVYSYSTILRNNRRGKETSLLTKLYAMRSVYITNFHCFAVPRNCCSEKFRIIVCYARVLVTIIIYTYTHYKTIIEHGCPLKHLQMHISNHIRRTYCSLLLILCLYILHQVIVKCSRHICLSCLSKSRFIAFCLE